MGEPWWLWVEDPLNDHIYHSEYFLLQKKQVSLLGLLSQSDALQRRHDDRCLFPHQVVTGEPQNVVFTIPIFEPLPSQYYIKVVSDRWLGAEAVCIINFQNLILPERHPPHTGEDRHHKGRIHHNLHLFRYNFLLQGLYLGWCSAVCVWGFSRFLSSYMLISDCADSVPQSWTHPGAFLIQRKTVQAIYF